MDAGFRSMGTRQGSCANTDASNFASGTGTSLANSQYGDPNGDQRSKSPEQLAGNSRARANINLSGDAAG